MVKVVIVHRWDGTPKSDWYPWLKRELEKKNFKVEVPAMPDTKHPKIETWVPFLLKTFAKVDENTYFVGHSVGCQAIIRLLEKISAKIGGAIFVGGWLMLKDEATQSKEEREVAEPWLKSKIDFGKVRKTTKNFMAIFSDNDPYVPMENAKILKEKLGAKVIIEKNKGHYMESDGVREIPSVLNELLKMTVR